MPVDPDGLAGLARGFPDLLVLVGHDGRVLAASAPASVRLGLETGTDLVARSPEPESVQVLLARAGRGEELPAAAVALRDRDGELGTWHVDAWRAGDAVALRLRAPDEGALYRTIVTTMAEGLVVRDREGRILVMNTRAEELLGLPRATFEPGAERDPRWQAHGESGEPLGMEDWPAFTALRTGQPQRDVIVRITRPDGSVRWVSANAEPVVPPGAGAAYASVNTFADITERMLRDEERRRAAAQQGAVADLGVLALAGTIPGRLMREAAVAMATTLGLDAAAVLERDLRRGVLVPAATIGEWPAVVPVESGSLAGQLLEATGAVVVRDLRADSRRAGDAAWTHAGARFVLGAPVRVGGEVVAVLVGTARQPRAATGVDASFAQAVANVLASALERARTEDLIRHRALHDALTELPNRALVMERVEHALVRAERSGDRIALLFLDLDHFKDVNDSLGHARGDELLVAVGQRIRQAVRPPDTVGRLGGDEYVVLCEDVGDEHGPLVVAERLAAALRRPFRLGEEEVFVSASIGVALPGPESRTPVELLRDADAAMYRAKAAGRARHEVFDASLRARALERVRSEAALRRAVEREELVLHYQPIVGMAGGAVDGVEALVRWERPGVGLVPPGDFVPLAEASGLIVDLGAWVVREACRQLAQWNASRPDDPPLCISINLSARQVQDDGLPAVVGDAITEWGLDPDQLQLEITETVLIEDTPATSRRVGALLDLGVRLVLDDFGRGYSSLHYLTRFPITGLKLDRAFVAGLGERSTAAITAGVVGIARSLDLAVVAEGVETTEQLAAVQELGCARVQGFLLSPPVVADAVDPLRAERPWRPLLAANAPGSGQASRKRSTASTRRWSFSASRSPSFAKMLVTCFSTARGVTTSFVGDRAVGAALGHQPQHLALARRELRQRVVAAAAAHQLRDDRRIERRAALGDAAHGGGELVDVRDAVLEQVAHALGRVLQQLERVGRLDVLREDEHADGRPLGADRLRRNQALVRVRRRHADVDHCDVGLVHAHLAHQVVCGAGLRHHVEAAVREQARHALAEEHRVISQHDAHRAILRHGVASVPASAAGAVRTRAGARSARRRRALPSARTRARRSGR